MKRILLFTIISLAFSVKAYSQFNASFEGIGQWYIDDKKIKLTVPDTADRIRTNAYLKFDYSLENWDFGLQAESYLPKALLNFSPDLKGVNIGTLYARYHNTKLGLDITGGHLYEQFGSGLILRTWEDRQLGLNNAILGGRVVYSLLNGTTLTALAGKQRIGMGFDLSDGMIYAANLNTSITDLLSTTDFSIDAGLSYVGRYEKDTISELPAMLNSYSARLHFLMNGYYIGGEYVYKGKDAVMEFGMPRMESMYPGQALLINFGYTQKGLGIDVNLRRLENMGFYSQRNLVGNEYNTGVMNYLPALTKQYDYSLQNIYLYAAQPYLQFVPPNAGEIGGQIDVIYEFKKKSLLGGKYGTNIALNASYWAGLKADMNMMAGTYTAEFLALGERYYNDLGIEIRKKTSKNWSFIAMYLNQYYNFYIEAHEGAAHANTLTGEATFKFGKAQSIRLEAQHQWAYKTRRELNQGEVIEVKDNQNWIGGTLEYTLNYNWSVYVSDMYNYGYKNADERIHYYNAGITFIKGATRVSAGYGRQRGGLLCVGGVCRTVPESAGLTLNILTTF